VVILGLDTGASDADMPEKMMQFSSKVHQEEEIGMEDIELMSMYEYKQLSKEKTLFKGLELFKLTDQIRIDLKVQAIAAKIKRVAEGDIKLFRSLVDVKLKGLIKVVADKLIKENNIEKDPLSRSLLSKCPVKVSWEELEDDISHNSKVFSELIGTIVEGGKKNEESRASRLIKYFKIDKFIKDKLIISPKKQSPNSKMPGFKYFGLQELEDPAEMLPFTREADYRTPQKQEQKKGHNRDKTGGSGMTDLFSMVESPVSHRYLMGEVQSYSVNQEELDETEVLQKTEQYYRRFVQTFIETQDDYFGNANRSDDLLFLVEVIRDNLNTHGFDIRSLALDLLLTKAKQMQTLSHRLTKLQIIPEEREPLYYQLESIFEQISILHLELPDWEANQNSLQARGMTDIFKQMVDLNIDLRLVLTPQRHSEYHEDKEFDESLGTILLDPPSPAKTVESILTLFWSRSEKYCQYLSINLGILVVACKTLLRLVKLNKEMLQKGKNIINHLDLIETLFLFVASTIVKNNKNLVHVERELAEILNIELTDNRQSFDENQSIEAYTNSYFLLYLLMTQHTNLVQRTNKHKRKLDLIFNILPKLDDRDYRKSLLLGCLMNHENDVNDIRTRAFHTEVCNRLAAVQSQTFPSVLKTRDSFVSSVQQLQAKASHLRVFLDPPNRETALVISDSRLNYLLAYVELLSFATQGKNVLTEQLSQNIFSIEVVKQLLPALNSDFFLLQAVLSYLKNTFIEVEKEPSQAVLDAFKDIYLILFEQLKDPLMVKYNGIISMVELVKSVSYMNVNVQLCIFSYFKNVKSGWYSKQLVDHIHPTFEQYRSLTCRDERIQKKLDAFVTLSALQQVPFLHKEMKPIPHRPQSIVDSFLVKNIVAANRETVPDSRAAAGVLSFNLNNMITPVNFMPLDEERPPVPTLHEPEFETQSSHLFDGDIRSNQVEILRHYPDAAFTLMTKLLKSDDLKPLLSRQSDCLIAYLGISSLGQKDLTKSTLETHETHLDQLLDLLAWLLLDPRIKAKSSTTREMTNIVRRSLLFYKLSDSDFASGSDRYSFILLARGQHDLQRQEMIRARNEKLANSKIIDAYIRLLR